VATKSEDKARLIPEWAADHPTLVAAFRKQEIDPATIFGFVPKTGLKCDIFEIFGWVCCGASDGRFL
jgi:hypothetical protein